MANTNPRNIVSFSYFDPFNAFESVRPELESRLPFKNLHWKPANQSLRTISSLPVKVIPETDGDVDPQSSLAPIIKFLVINCSSIDEYRAKVRPLVRQWLPSPAENGSSGERPSVPAKRIVLLHSNSSISESNLFKTVSFSDKFYKDFPFLQVVEVKSIYKSEKDKGDFWNNTVYQLRKYTMEVFQQRLGYLESELRSVTENDFMSVAALQENILNLFLTFHLNDEASKELDALRDTLFATQGVNLPQGDLKVPFYTSGGEESAHQKPITHKLEEQRLTTYELKKFFFIKQCELIQNSYTQAAGCLRFYQVVKEFLRTVEQDFAGSPALAQFKYSFIDAMISTGIIANDSSDVSREILADFKIIQRDCWLDLAFSSQGFRIDGRAYPSETLQCDLDSIKSSFQDSHSFQQSYIDMTKNIIQLLSSCESKKYRTVDLLSVDIGLFYLQQKNYTSAISILQSCHEYYKESQWLQIAVKLLGSFIDCLKTCSVNERLMIDGESIPVTTVLSNSVLDLLTFTHRDARKSYWWNYFLDINKEANDSLIYPLDNLFRVQVDNELFVTKPNIFALRVDVRSTKVPQDILFTTMRLLLKNQNDDLLTFQLSDCLIHPGDNEIFLEASKITFGSFELINIEFTVGNTIFCKEFAEGDGSELQLKQPTDSRNFDVTVLPARHLQLMKNSLTLQYTNEAELSEVELVLTILPSNGVSKPSVSFDVEGKNHAMTIKGTTASEVEYFIQSPTDQFKLKQELTFKMTGHENKEFYQCSIKSISCALPLSVSVEDIMREGSFFFKFLINSSSASEPIVLYRSHLKPANSEKFSVTGGFEPKTPLLLKGSSQETCLNFFQIQPKNEEVVESNDFFQLEILFSTLKDQLDHLVTNAVLIQGSPRIASKMDNYKDIWNSNVLAELAYDYSLFETEHKIKLNSSRESITLMWRHLHSRIKDEDFMEALKRCLSELKNGFQLSHLEISEYTKDIEPSTLVVDVNFPLPSKFFSVDLRSADEHGDTPEVGQSLQFRVRIYNADRGWGSNGTEVPSYVFEISNTNEWLIDGRRRFSLQPEVDQYPIKMIPLRRGYLRYPKVEITEGGRKIPDVHYTNAHDSILVI